jgi:hypothetical protein
MGVYSGSPNDIIVGEHAMMVVKPKEGSDAVAFPVDCILKSKVDNVGLWTAEPVPPEGYKAMGHVYCTNFTYWCGHCEEVACIREDLTIPGGVIDDKDQRPNSISWFYDTHYWYYALDWSYCPVEERGIIDFWKIFPPDHEYQDPDLAYLNTGTYVSWCSDDPPEHHDVMNILKFKLPLLVEAPEQNYTPQLTGYDTPPMYTDPVMSREVLVPCTIIRDLQFEDDIGWQVANSPFYRLERQVFYKRIGFLNNTTSIVQPFDVEIRAGVTTTESEEFRTETAVSIRYDVGVNIDWFSSRVSVTLSQTFGYESIHSISELNEVAYWIPIHAPPHKAVACWQKYTRFVLKRHNGTSLETVKQWEFGIDSYVTDEYPD